MSFDHHISRATGMDRSSATHGFSRRGFLLAGVAAGGGLMLSLYLPFTSSDAGAAAADSFSPNAFIRIEGNGEIVLTMPYVEMGHDTYQMLRINEAPVIEVHIVQSSEPPGGMGRPALRPSSPQWRTRSMRQPASACERCRRHSRIEAAGVNRSAARSPAASSWASA